jgi:glycosyltransferase involved in cell wall biosynthesis
MLARCATEFPSTRMITGKDIIYISTIEWTFLWQSHQEIATRLAAAGNRVLYIENMGMRAPRLSDAGRVVARLKRWAVNRNRNEPDTMPPNIHICSPLVLPPFGSEWRRALNRRFFLKALKQTVDNLGLSDPIIWTYLPTDTCVDLIQMLRSPESLVVYYCVADFTKLTTQVQQVTESESELLKVSDVIFASCSQLARPAAQLNSAVYLSPHGVNLEAFPQDDQLDVHDCPAELLQVPRPIIGYVGGLHRHVDLDLIKQMALLRPEWSWVFVGSVQVPLGDLQALPNVRFLGQKNHNELVDYIRNVDVCIVPYANTEATATVLPTKINEYLAVGKPVVSIDIPAVREFNELHQVLNLVSGGPDDFLAAIDEALATALDEVKIARRREVAAGADWRLRLQEISEIIELHLAKRTRALDRLV